MKKPLLILFLFLGLNLFSQVHNIHLDSISSRVDELVEHDDYQSALTLITSSLENFKLSEDWENYFNAVIKFAWVNEDPEEAIAYYNNQINLANEKLSDSDNLLADLYHNLGGVFYGEEEYLKAIDIYLKALEVRNKALKFPAYDLARTNINIGKCYAYSHYYVEGIQYLKAAKKNYEGKGVDRFDKVNTCNLELAYCYSSIGEFQIAEGLYQEALDFSNKNYGQNDYETAFVLNLMGDMFYDRNKYTLAKEHYLKAEKIYRLDTQYKEDQAVSLNGLGNVYKAQGNTSKAVEFYKQTASIIEQEFGKNDLSTADSYENIGLAYKQGGQNDEALRWLNKALEIRIQLLKDQKSVDLNASYHNLGDFYLKQNNYKHALEYLQKAIQQQVLQFDNQDIFSNPSVEQLELLVGSKQGLLKDLNFKGLALQEGYSQSGDSKYREAARSTFVLAARLIDQMRESFLGSSTKAFWLNETFPVFENAIESCWQSYQVESTEEQFNEIIGLMEQNKAVLLLEALQANKGVSEFELPDSLIRRQQQLIKKVTSLQSDLVNALDKGSGNSIVHSLEKELVQIKKDKALFEEGLRDNYPKFKRISNSSATISGSDMKRLLSDQEVLIEYFVGDLTTYVAATSKNQFTVKTFPTKELRKHAEDLLYVIHPSRSHKLASKDFFQRFTKSSHTLYGLLLEEVLKELPTSIDQLIIVPDDIISFVPFDLLIQEPQESVEVNFSPESLNYLINSFTTSYTYSGMVLTNLLTTEKTQTAKGSFLGYAPGFQGRKDTNSRGSACNFETLNPLKYNQPEVERIKAIMGGKTLIGSTATKSSFLETSLNFSILHLATHACADPGNSARNRIFFSDGYLYTHELSTLNNKADMVVLSACETGIGEYKRGEGVMSLARGFAYSGTPSITMSLWQVDDASTAELMVRYYEHLNNGHPKDIALRNAKLDYFSNQEELFKLHPQFWAAFVHYGDRIPIIKKSSLTWYLAGGVLLLLAFGTWRYYRQIITGDA